MPLWLLPWAGVLGIAFGSVLGPATGLAFGGVLGAATPPGLLHSCTHRVSHFIICGLSCRCGCCSLPDKLSDGLGAAGTDEAAMTARLMLQTPAPCFPPQGVPDFCKMAHRCTPKGHSSAGFGHSPVWNSGQMARQGSRQHLAIELVWHQR